MRNQSKENSTIEYIEKLYAEEDIHLQNIRKSIDDNGLRAINIRAYEGKILQVLLKIHGAKNIVEVGTLAGYSTLWLARALPEDGFLYSFEKEEKTAEIARNNISQTDVLNKVEIISGDAHENLKKIEDKAPFDAIFIDAEKSGYIKYLEWADQNLRQGGLIIADNVLFNGMVADKSWSNKQEEKIVNHIENFNQAIKSPLKYESIIIPTLEGLSVSIKLT